ncbi:hypothetical protein PDESU_04724 [Pontiella desulfatans]|uniref:HTH arsR-type domain-containing protein n=1 Tax=Pontiella desulfatans TaxID=2750659 RepID=A0A6C2U9S2_PONDE|nr:metalloregulator ArsR/SmtB family transcription factor [Pontiella desulfatans]VGO16134.1 hypothetical protein PDESU_04724 [Pontiella desulfatans]
MIANDTRLNLLRELLRCNECTVAMLGSKVGIAEAYASTQLRTLNSRGLITSRPSGKWVYYSAQPNNPLAKTLLTIAAG